MLWETKLEYSAISVPMTYQGKDGKQYVPHVAVVVARTAALLRRLIRDTRGAESLG